MITHVSRAYGEAERDRAPGARQNSAHVAELKVITPDFSSLTGAPLPESAVLPRIRRRIHIPEQPPCAIKSFPALLVKNFRTEQVRFLRSLCARRVRIRSAGFAGGARLPARRKAVRARTPSAEKNDLRFCFLAAGDSQGICTSHQSAVKQAASVRQLHRIVPSSAAV